MLLCSFEGSFYIINIIITCHITCLYRLPRSLRSLAMTYNSSHSLPGVSPVRGHYLQTNVYSFVCFLVVTPFFRLRYSSAEKEGKSAAMTYNSSHSLTGLAPFSRVVRPEIRFLNFGVPSVLYSISKFFEFLHSIARLHMGRSLRSAPPKSASWIIRLSALLPFVLKSFGFFHSFRSLRCYEFRASPSTSFGLRPHSTENPLQAAAHVLYYPSYYLYLNL